MIDEKKKTKKIRCPECLNYMQVTICKNGANTGKCQICKSVISCKQCSSKEKRIKIIKNFQI